jgi:hypothetical protein
MDAFWTAEEAAFRRAAREHFGRRQGPGPAAGPEVPSGLGLAGRAGVVEEAACHDPKLGQAMTSAATSAEPLGPAAAAVLRTSLLAGMAANVLEAGLRAARGRGAFASSLMGCREVQESLAGLLAGAELMRLGACRLCRLLDRREVARAEAEAVRLLAGARALEGDVRAVALSLLGPAWIAEHLPQDDLFSADERTTT